MPRIKGVPAWKLMLGLPVFLLEVLTSRRFVDYILRVSDSLSEKRRSEMVKLAAAKDEFFARRKKQFRLVGYCLLCGKCTVSGRGDAFTRRLCGYHRRLEKMLRVS